MAIRSRHLLQTCTLGVLLVACTVLIASSPVPSPTRVGRACAELQAWAQQYRDISLSLEQLSRFDRAHRIAIFNVASPAARAEWWRAQIRQLGERPDLTPLQRALTVEAIGLLTPALYRHEADATAAFRTFWRRADPAFASFELRRAWVDLGAVVAPAAASNRAADDFYCECKLGGGVGQCGGTSCGFGNGCNIRSGCGVSGLDMCDGMCQ
jgi:hypothetical protein